MNIGDIFSIHNLLLLCALFFNINIYIEDMKIISGGVSYSLLSMQILLNIVLLFVTRLINNEKIELLIWVLFSISIIISDYIKKKENIDYSKTSKTSKISKTSKTNNSNGIFGNTNYNYGNKIGYDIPKNGLGSIVDYQLFDITQ